MDLTPSDDQQAIIDLATRIVADHTGVDRLRELERDGRDHDDQLWAALAEADLLGLCLPTSAGGGGYGLLEATLVAEVIGRHVAPVPYAEAVAAGRLLADAGDPAAAQVVSGTVVVPALREGPESVETAHPATIAEPVDDGWVLTGDKRLVAGATSAVVYLVSASVDGAVALFVVDADAVTDHVDNRTSRGQVLRSLHLDRCPARRVELDDGVAASARLRHELRILRCGILAGVAAGALDLAAQHCKQREQFGAPIGTFQAVGHRLADAWLDTNLMQTTTRQAAWRTDSELPATQAAASAAIWACEGSARVVNAAQHVHGGVGVDVDYPVHRYFRWATELELQVGGAGASIRDLGAALAAEPLTIG